MAARNDVSFGFDPKPFLNGLKHVTKGIDGLGSRMGRMAAQMTNKLLATAAAVLSIRKIVLVVSQQIPEIGQAFGIAKEIILKNLFWPLRQMVVPLLQKMLDWVRDHRTLFVKWGEALANMFRAVWVVAKNLYDTFLRIVDYLGPQFKKLFGDSFENILNLLSVKFVALLFYLQRLFGPIAKGLWNMIRNLLPALVKAWQDLAPWIQKALDMVVRMVENLLPDLEALFKNIISSAAELLAKILEVGTSVEANLTNLLRQALGLVNEVVTSVKNIGLGFLEGVKPHLGPIIDNLATILGSTRDLLKNWNDPKFGANLKSVAKTLADAAGGAAQLVTAFASSVWSSFTGALSDAMVPIQGIATEINNIVQAIVNFDKKTGLLQNIGKILGSTLGEALMFSLQLIQFTIMGITTSIQGLALAVRNLPNLLKGTHDSALEKEITDWKAETATKFADAWGAASKYWEKRDTEDAKNSAAVLKGLGELFGVKSQSQAYQDLMGDKPKLYDPQANPQPPVAVPRKAGTVPVGSGGTPAQKQAASRARAREAQTTVAPVGAATRPVAPTAPSTLRLVVGGGLTINVTEGDARKAGQDFGQGLSYQFRQAILNSAWAGSF